MVAVTSPAAGINIDMAFTAADAETNRESAVFESAEVEGAGKNKDASRASNDSVVFSTGAILAMFAASPAAVVAVVAIDR
jgi:hypothetical protein